jgi:phytoene dehydrogenase-like protein
MDYQTRDMSVKSENIVDWPESTADAVVIGGGLGGLVTAAFLARAGQQVVLYEKSHELGGRARTQVLDGFHFNLGPHALYSTGLGTAVLKELGIEVHGGTPARMSGFAVRSKTFHTLPLGFVSLFSTDLLRAAEKFEAARLLIKLPSLNAAHLQCVSVKDWLRQNIVSDALRELMAAIVRVTTYTNDPERLSSGAALQQLQRSFSGVLYLHGGWQTLVDRLRKLNEQLGVRMSTGCTVEAVLNDSSVRGVRLSEGRVTSSRVVVIASSPSVAMSLVKNSRTLIKDCEASARPVRISSLDVSLRKLPRPKALIALGIDQPIYASVHSSVARVAPDGGALIHVAHYGKPDEPPADDTETQLVDILNAWQPGWQRQLVHRRFLPHLTVSHSLVNVDHGGLAGRPGPSVPDIPGLYVVGDWVGPEGMLVDASLASARRAVTEILSLPWLQDDEKNRPEHHREMFL